tara:strand:- start:2060 stop:2557 length:498 start_codon:yes stop_codon:yes gene_type:complete
MKKYEAVIILNPNLSSKANNFVKDFEKLLKNNSFNIQKKEDVGRRQLAYSINNHNKGHYLLFNIEGDASKLIEIENKIKYDESIIRHIFITVKDHSGEDSQLLKDSKNKKNDTKEKSTDKSEENENIVQENQVDQEKVTEPNDSLEENKETGVIEEAKEKDDKDE